MRRRASESSRPPELNDPDLDISLVRADSLDSLSSGGDSDGGPAEPTAAEISLLSASIDARNIEAARNVEPTSPFVADPAIEEGEEVTPVFPCGFHRLPSAMRPPVRRGHVRSSSAGGNFSLTARGQVQRNNSSATAKDTKGW